MVEPLINKPGQPRPAHRPSRREEIIDAAVRVFGRAGYVAASVEDIALESGVAATAIYYHFGGKEELFNQALRTALDRLSEAAYAARQSDSPEPAGTDSATVTLRRVIRAGMARAISHPEETRFLLHQTFRPTTEARKLQQDWEERHVQRTFDYLPQPATPPRTPRDARVRHAAHLLASRVITYTTIVAQESRLAGGPLSEHPMPSIVTAVEDLCVRVVSAAGDSAPATPARTVAKKAAPSLVVVPGDEPVAPVTARKSPARKTPAKKTAAGKAAQIEPVAEAPAGRKPAARKSAAGEAAVQKATAAKTPAARRKAVLPEPATEATTERAQPAPARAGRKPAAKRVAVKKPSAGPR
jgi:AcrR family transcriptional regulator